MKTNGPGRYDALATFARIQTGADLVVVIIRGGELGHGFAVQGTEDAIRTLPDVLEDMARQIRKEISDDKPTA